MTIDSLQRTRDHEVFIFLRDLAWPARLHQRGFPHVGRDSRYDYGESAGGRPGFQQKHITEVVTKTGSARLTS